MDFDADYDSGNFFYKNDQPTHFLRFSRFFLFFSKFLLFRTILDESCESPSKTTSTDT